MDNPKPEIYATLDSLGYECRQGGQRTFAQTPAVTFRVDNNSVELDLDNKISHQNITATIDIFADDSVTASRIVGEVEVAMRSIGYRLAYSTDVPAPEGALQHINCRFETVK